MGNASRGRDLVQLEVASWNSGMDGSPQIKLSVLSGNAVFNTKQTNVKTTKLVDKVYNFISTKNTKQTGQNIELEKGLKLVLTDTVVLASVVLVFYITHQIPTRRGWITSL